jgi:hypothetical protein
MTDVTMPDRCSRSRVGRRVFMKAAAAGAVGVAMPRPFAAAGRRVAAGRAALQRNPPAPAVASTPALAALRSDDAATCWSRRVSFRSIWAGSCSSTTSSSKRRRWRERSIGPSTTAATPSSRRTRSGALRRAAERTKTRSNPAAMVFSDGVLFDPADRLFKMWYGRLQEQ